MTKWRVAAVLSVAQFLMVLDSTVMNVSISQLVEDLNTEVTKIQAAITMYALVMAAFMIIGAKLGDIFGRRRAFAVGLVVYGTGSTVTAISPNVGVLIFGWSLLEGLGAALILPALAALVAGNYGGNDRRLVYALLGGVMAAGAAAGPIIGGWVTTTLTWRLVFIVEAGITILILVLSPIIKDAVREGPPVRLDFVGAMLSALGMALLVFGILMSSEWGWVEPRHSPIEPLGFSLVPFLILGGGGLLLLCALWLEFRQRHDLPVLVRPQLFGIVPLRSALIMLLVQMLIIGGLMFVTPLFLQIVLGYDALRTGIAMLPLSVALLIASFAGAPLGAHLSPRLVVQAGMGFLFAGSIVVLATIDVDIDSVGFGTGLALFGVGLGLLASQLANVTQSAVGEEDRSEVGGLQYAAQNLGVALGTALVGTVLLGGLLSGVESRVYQNEAISPELEAGVGVALESGLSFVPADTVEQAALDAGFEPPEVNALVDDYEDAQVEALRLALGVLAVAAIISVWFTRNLPGRESVAVEEDVA
jgi:EmrB/QacA subfamily drug resistance transporter